MTRPIFAFAATFCFGLVAVAVLYFQQQLNLLPCPLCVIQRMANLAVGGICLIAAIHCRAPRLYAASAGAFSLAGLGVAVWQVWLIHHPEQALSCGISPEERFLNNLPLASWLPSVFEANGDCTKVDWTFLTLSLPAWSVICFALLLALFVTLAVRKSPPH
jgi:disulfide bond formation protein DsbB